MTWTVAAQVANDVVAAAGGGTLTGDATGNVIYAGIDADDIDGGGSIDTVSYRWSHEAVTFVLDDTVSTGGTAEGDTLANIESLIGSAFADRLTSNAAGSLLSGGAGNDTLIGGAGNDGLSGGDGGDTLDGRDDDNILTGGDGADRFFLNWNGTGTTTVTDFDISEGDRVRINTATGNEDTLAKLGLPVADNGLHANITSTDGSEVYMILENIDHASITDASFINYFDIV